MRPDGILIRVKSRAERGKSVPSVPTAADRYSDYMQKRLAYMNAVPGNNFPWKFRNLDATVTSNG